jgi:hypothetical protein
MKDSTIVLTELREWLVKRAAGCKEGAMMSLAESIHGETDFNEVIRVLDRLKNKEN